MEDVEIVLDVDCDPVFDTQADALWEPDNVPLGLNVAVVDIDVTPVKLTVPLFELVPEEVTEVDKVAEIVDDDDSVPEPVCEVERELLGDAVYETDTVPHGVADTDRDVVVETVVLAVSLEEIVPDTDCEPVLDLEEETLKETVTVPLGLTVTEGDGDILPVKLADPL